MVRVIMPTELEFTEDESAQWHLLVAQDTEKSRVERHHASVISNREYIQRRRAQGVALLKRMNDAHPGRAFVVDHQWEQRPQENPP